MMYPLNKEGFTMIIAEAIETVCKQHQEDFFTWNYIDLLVIYNNLLAICDIVIKYQQRIKRKNADLDWAFGKLIIELSPYDVLKHTEAGEKRFQEYIDKIDKMKK